jgi:hypothetical protein
MSKSRESRTRTVEVSLEGEVPGIRVIGFHGEVDAAHTPARRAPLLVDEEGWLVRLSPEELSTGEEASTGPAFHRVRIERGLLQVNTETGPLPGVGTKLGPWPARVGDTVVLLGEAERRAAAHLASLVTAGEPEVREFVFWVARGCPPAAPARAVQLDTLVAWCCSMEEAHSLWRHVLQEARLAVMSAFAQGQPPHALEEAAWWLSRAALTDEDLYLSAAALKHAGTPDAEAMLRAMLREAPGTAVLQQRMAEQLVFLGAEARVVSASHPTHDASTPGVWPYPGATPSRDSVRMRASGGAR